MYLNDELRQLLNKSILSEEAFTLVHLGADPDILNESGYSLLHLLIFNKRIADALMLARNHNANINVKDKQGFPPLYYMLNDKFTPNNLMDMIRLGADPNTVNKAGKAPIHYLISNGSFKLAKELLEKNSKSINLKSVEGTPLELMLNVSKSSNIFKTEDYIDMVRLGADIDSKDNDSVSLLNFIIKTGSLDKAKELVVLSKIPAKQRLFFRPQLSDYFVREDGIQSLVDDLQNNELSHEDIISLGKYPYTKELVIKHIKKMEIGKREKLVDSALSPRTTLNYFFSVQRGWFMTSNSRGTLSQLVEIQKEIIAKKLTPSEPNAHVSAARP